MIRRFQALGYRCLRYVDLELDRFQILVGANASGKSTMFDAVEFLADLVTRDLLRSVNKRTDNFQDLVWNRPERDLRFELALEVEMPDSVRSLCASDDGYDRLRYELAVREHSPTDLRIEQERWFPVISSAPSIDPDRARFPDAPAPPGTILTKFGQTPGLSSPRALPGGGDRGTLGDFLWLGREESELQHCSVLGRSASLPNDQPLLAWLRTTLGRIELVALDSTVLRRPDPAGGGNGDLGGDGSGLPWIVDRFRANDPVAYEEWLGHLRTAIPEIEVVEVVKRPEDRHAYLRLRYRSGLSAPSWSLSDGTLRLLALTLPSYLRQSRPLSVIEEPEHGIHPMALDALYASLSSAYGSQVFAATHSPVLLKMAQPEEVLCFAQDASGATDIVRGDRHPLLADWRGSVDTTLLFATGVIG